MALTDAAALDASVAPAGPRGWARRWRQGSPANLPAGPRHALVARCAVADPARHVHPRDRWLQRDARRSGIWKSGLDRTHGYLERIDRLPQPILTNTLFAGVQFLIAFGIVYRRTCKPALVLSIVWSFAVWWFGEGLGAGFSGGATPFGGGPGSVLFYAVLAVLIWPTEGDDRPFVAARTVGSRTAKVVWAILWLLLALLCLVGSGRSPQGSAQRRRGTEHRGARMAGSHRPIDRVAVPAPRNHDGDPLGHVA